MSAPCAPACERSGRKKYGISSSLLYHWQEAFLAGAREGFERSKHGPSTAEHRKRDEQARQIDRMRSVIAEITAENIDLKKFWGVVNGEHVEVTLRGQVRQDIERRHEQTAIAVTKLLSMWGISRSC